MKVCIECTRNEFEALAATIADGVAYKTQRDMEDRSGLREPNPPSRSDSTGGDRKVWAGDDVPNRDREEGVQ